MQTTSLILAIVGLSFLLISLVFIYLWIGRSKQKGRPDGEAEVTFETLQLIINNRASSNGELGRAVERILRDYGVIGSGNVEKYTALLGALCLHPHTDSQLIVRFEKELRDANPIYKEEIQKALKNGLAARDRR